MWTVIYSILGSSNILLLRLVMKAFLQPFPPCYQFKQGSCQLLVKEWAVKTVWFSDYLDMILVVDCDVKPQIKQTYEPPNDKPTKWHMRLATTQISLGIHPVWPVITVHMKEAGVLSYPTECIAKTDQMGRWPGLSESLLHAQSFWWFCHVSAHIASMLKNLHGICTWTVCGTFHIFEFHVWHNIHAPVACPTVSGIKLTNKNEFIPNMTIFWKSADHWMYAYGEVMN